MNIFDHLKRKKSDIGRLVIYYMGTAVFGALLFLAVFETLPHQQVFVLSAVNDPVKNYKIDYDNNFYVNGVSQGAVSASDNIVVSKGASLTINGKHEFNTITVNGANSVITQDGVIVNPQRSIYDYTESGNGTYTQGTYLQNTLHILKGFIKLVRTSDYNAYEYKQSLPSGYNSTYYYCNDPNYINNVLRRYPNMPCTTDDANFVFNLNIGDVNDPLNGINSSVKDVAFLLKIDGKTICNSKNPNSQYGDSESYGSCYVNKSEYGSFYKLNQQSPVIPYVVSGNRLAKGGEITLPFELLTYSNSVSFDFVKKQERAWNNLHEYEDLYAGLGYESMAGPKNPGQQAFYLDQNKTQMGLQWNQFGGSFYMTRQIINSKYSYWGMVRPHFKSTILDTNIPVNADTLVDYGNNLKNSPMFNTSDYTDDKGRVYNFSKNNIGYPSASEVLQRNGKFNLSSRVVYNENSNTNQIMLNTQPTILIANKITIKGGSIDVSGKGYGSSNGSTVSGNVYPYVGTADCYSQWPMSGTSVNGAGPGGGITTYYGYEESGIRDDSGGGGGGFGGLGGRGHNWNYFVNGTVADTQRGGTYGTPTLIEPDFTSLVKGTYGFLKGSAGGSGVHYNDSGNNFSCGSPGGGGIVLITKKDALNSSDSDRIEISSQNLINGKIQADGASFTDGRYGSAGSGGLILIKTETLAFTENRGIITARGGISPRHDGYEGPGGGGRVYVVAKNVEGVNNLSYKDLTNLPCRGTIGTFGTQTDGTEKYCNGGYSTDGSDGIANENNSLNFTSDDTTSVRIVATRGKIDFDDKDSQSFFKETFYPETDYRAARNEPGTVYITNDFKGTPSLSLSKSMTPNPTDPGRVETISITVNAVKQKNPITIIDTFNSVVFDVNSVKNTTNITGVVYSHTAGTNVVKWVITGRGDLETVLTFRVTLKNTDDICGKQANQSLLANTGESGNQITILCNSKIKGDIYGGTTLNINGVKIDSESVLTSGAKAITVDSAVVNKFPKNTIKWDEFQSQISSYISGTNLDKYAKSISGTNLLTGSKNLYLDARTTITNNGDLVNSASGGIWQVPSIVGQDAFSYAQRGTLVAKTGNITIGKSITRLNPNSTDNLGIIAGESGSSIMINADTTNASATNNVVTNVNASFMAPYGDITINGAPNTTLIITGQLIAKNISIRQNGGTIIIRYNNLQQSNPLPIFGQALNITSSGDTL